MAETEISSSAMNHDAQKLAPRGYLSVAGIIILSGAVLLTGVGYLLLEYALTRRIEDSLFVSMLLCATMILLVGMRQIYQYIARRGVDFYAFVLASSDPQEVYAEHEYLCRTVLNGRRMTAFGLAYGAAVGFGSLLLGAWQGWPQLRLALAAFLFAANFTTGVGFYSLLSFFVLSARMGRQARVDLWQTRNPSTEFLTGATRRVAFLASLYVAICFSCIILSVLPIRGLVIAYSIFEGLLIVLTLIVPLLPLTAKIREAKHAALWELDGRIQAAFRKTLDDKPEPADEDLARLHALLELRERIEAIETWPSKLRSVAAALSIVILSSIPVFLSVILERLT